MRDDYDVIVIGGGPAGSSAARRSAQLAMRVLLLEKKPMPRPKLCGGWVSGYALRRLALPIPADLIETNFNSIELTHRSAHVSFAPSRPLGVFVDRARFDHFLVREAEREGAAVRFETARELSRDGSSSLVHTSGHIYRAGSVIVCTGASNAMLGDIRPFDTPNRSAACIEQRLPIEYADRLRITPGAAHLHLGVVPHGYGWILHHGSYLMIGIGCRRSRIQNLQETYASFWNALGLPPELIKPKGHIIPLGGYRRSLGKQRWLLAGDAAGLVDAFSGEGIAGAIESGQMAAEALHHWHGDHAAQAYTAACRQKLLPDLRWSLRFARLCYWAPGLFLRLLSHRRASLENYVEVLERRSNYRALLMSLVRLHR